MPSPKSGRASSKISSKEALEGTLKIGLLKGAKGQVKLLDEAIVCRWIWFEACLLRKHLSLRGELLKARECKEERRESGGHMSLGQAKCLKPILKNLIRERPRLMENHKDGGLQCI